MALAVVVVLMLSIIFGVVFEWLGQLVRNRPGAVSDDFFGGFEVAID